jgi:hypothetical protein
MDFRKLHDELASSQDKVKWLEEELKREKKKQGEEKAGKTEGCTQSCI